MLRTVPASLPIASQDTHLLRCRGGSVLVQGSGLETVVLDLLCTPLPCLRDPLGITTAWFKRLREATASLLFLRRYISFNLALHP